MAQNIMNKTGLILPTAQPVASKSRDEQAGKADDIPASSSFSAALDKQIKPAEQQTQQTKISKKATSNESSPAAKHTETEKSDLNNGKKLSEATHKAEKNKSSDEQTDPKSATTHLGGEQTVIPADVGQHFAISNKDDLPKSAEATIAVDKVETLVTKTTSIEGDDESAVKTVAVDSVSSATTDNMPAAATATVDTSLVGQKSVLRAAEQVKTKPVTLTTKTTDETVNSKPATGRESAEKVVAGISSSTATVEAGKIVDVKTLTPAASAEKVAAGISPSITTAEAEKTGDVKTLTPAASAEKVAAGISPSITTAEAEKPGDVKTLTPAAPANKETVAFADKQVVAAPTPQLMVETKQQNSLNVTQVSEAASVVAASTVVVKAHNQDNLKPLASIRADILQALQSGKLSGKAKTTKNNHQLVKLTTESTVGPTMGTQLAEFVRHQAARLKPQVADLAHPGSTILVDTGTHRAPQFQSATASQTLSSTTTTPSTLATMDIQPNLQSTAWGRVMSSRVVWMAREGVREAQLKLNPANLGPVEVKLHMQNDQATVTFVAHHATTRDALEQALPRLRDSFADSGLALANAEVTDQHAEQQQQQSPDTEIGIQAMLRDDNTNNEDSQIELRNNPVITGLSLYA